jgi:hypothetical protein
MSYKNISILLLMMVISQWTQGQLFEETQRITKAFKASPGMRVDISNKYGSVMVSTWSKDSVKIEVVRRISEKNEERFKKIKANIDFRFNATPGALLAETMFGSSYGSMMQNVKEATNFMSASNSKSRIDYKVYLPADVNIFINNKYGDVVLPAINGNASVTMSNGNLQAKEIKGYSSFNLSFGNAQIKSIENGTLTLNFINLNIDNAGNLNVDTKSSELVIGKVNSLKINSRRDQIKVMSAGSISGESYFSKLTIPQLKENCAFKLTYGELTEMTLDAAFRKVELLSQTCDINIKINAPTAYSALIKAVNAPLKLTEQLKAEVADYQKQISTTPVRFSFQRKGNDEKIKVNISDAELTIQHQ